MGTAKSREPDESGQDRTQRATCGCLPGTTECNGCSGDPDTLLMSRLAGGEEAAFDPLFRRNADRAYQIARRLLPIPQDAEDVAQEALLQVFASRGRWKPTARFTTWLYRIVVNLSLKRLRKAKTATAFALAAPPPDEEGPAGRDAQASPADEPEQVLLKKELAEAVVKAVNALPPSQRMAVTLHRFEGLSYAEIAAVMGCSISAVEALLHRAKQTLKKRLAPWVGVQERQTGIALPGNEAKNDDV